MSKKKIVPVNEFASFGLESLLRRFAIADLGSKRLRRREQEPKPDDSRVSKLFIEGLAFLFQIDHVQGHVSTEQSHRFGLFLSPKRRMGGLQLCFDLLPLISKSMRILCLLRADDVAGFVEEG